MCLKSTITMKDAMSTAVKLLTTPEQYLNDELERDIRHELIDGHIYAMTGASKSHNRISSNINREFGNKLINTPCEPFITDMKVRVNDNFFYPDVIVVCEDDDEHEYYTQSPVIIVEVLSKSTRRRDETTKRQHYLTTPSLQEYVLIEQDFVDIEVISRSNGWLSKRYYMGDEITFKSLGISISVEEIYYRVQNEDVSDYLNKKAEKEASDKEASQDTE